MKILVESNKTKLMLAKAGKIRFPVDVNSKGKAFNYVDNGIDDKDYFTHENIKYCLQYHSGCFYPYLYKEA